MENYCLRFFFFSVLFLSFFTSTAMHFYLLNSLSYVKHFDSLVVCLLAFIHFHSLLYLYFSFINIFISTSTTISNLSFFALIISLHPTRRVFCLLLSCIIQSSVTRQKTTFVLNRKAISTSFVICGNNEGDCYKKGNR